MKGFLHRCLLQCLTTAPSCLHCKLCSTLIALCMSVWRVMTPSACACLLPACGTGWPGQAGFPSASYSETVKFFQTFRRWKLAQLACCLQLSQQIQGLPSINKKIASIGNVFEEMAR